MTSNLSGSKRQKPPVPVFLATTIVIFFLSLSAADSVGFVPCYLDGTACSADAVALSSLPQLGDERTAPVAENSYSILPKHIVIPAIGLDLPVQNIGSRDINVLYENLKNGPIRYVDSARLGEDGNVLIFGHSSRIPVVKNRMYKAFNRVPELKAGDTITLTGQIDGVERSYLYGVVSVEQKDIQDPTAVVSLAKEGRRLTLVTCDTLTGETARFVLTADFIGVL